MITKIIFYNLFIVAFAFSQQKNIKVQYSFSVSMDESVTKNLSNDQQKAITDAQNMASAIIPLLIYNDSLAIFYSEEILNVDNDFSVNVAKAFCDCLKPIYTDLKKKINYFEEPDNLFFKNTNLYLKEKINSQWILSNEKKIIGNYICYKATQQTRIKQAENVLQKTITAWYCPDFPISIGPKGFGGLPGLIFELHDKNATFGLRSITAVATNEIIALPNVTNTVSKEDYWNEITNKMLKLKEEYEKNINK